VTVSRQKRTYIIFATTIGGIIEWYELFLYVYWSPIISKLFFSNDSHSVATMKTLFVFFVGFLSRPIGGLLFGHIGDRLGRKRAFFISIVAMTIPSFILGFFPFSGKLGLFNPLILCVLRFIQGLPAGGELPGAMCYLAECAPQQKRSFTCSFSFFGPQIGVIISIIESYFLETFLPRASLESWGWQLSFNIGGLLGLLGAFLRKRLEETPAFLHLEEKRKVLRKPIIETILRHKKDLGFGFFASFLDVVGFYMFSIFLGIYFNNVLKISETKNLLITLCSMVLSTITLPFLGMLGDRFKIKRLLIISALGMIIFSYPFYLSASHSSIIFTLVFQLILMLFLNMQFALLPRLIAELFPTSTRYTGIGLSFNLCDSVIGGIIPIVAFYLTDAIGNVATFVLLINIAACISLITFTSVKNAQLRKIDAEFN
jgi:MHS family proline/betaine transporter-like MFS transporter